MIDIQTLTIGSHVLFNGERVEVEGVVIFNGVVFLDNNENVYADMLDPIPITEELLTELGFEKKGQRGLEQWEKYIGEDFFVYVKYNPKTRRCRAEIIDEDLWTNYGNILCYDLHVLESFVFITTKQRLI